MGHRRSRPGELAGALDVAGEEVEQRVAGARVGAGGLEQVDHGRDAPGDDVTAPTPRPRLEERDVEREAQRRVELDAHAPRRPARVRAEQRELVGAPAAF